MTTIVRYPALGSSEAVEVHDAPAERALAPYPLVVFGHGFAVTPTIYARLLGAWTRDGYIVAAPIFPLGNANAPGGPNESDLVNQPGDMRFVITRLLAASRSPSDPLHGLIDPDEIAVAGQSDGGVTALAAAYDPSVRDRRVRAAVILSGAFDPFAPPFTFPRDPPPLLAVQGTGDTINNPANTEHYYRDDPGEKFELLLLGAEHLPPYTQPGPQLDTVVRVTLAFLDDVLKHHAATLQRLLAPGALGEAATLAHSP